MDLNWKLNKTEHIVQDEWIDFRKESFILPDGKEFSPGITIQEETLS